MSRISHDDMYNLHETADDIPGYIHKIITFPDLVCVIPAMFLIHECKFYARLIALIRKRSKIYPAQVYVSYLPLIITV